METAMKRLEVVEDVEGKITTRAEREWPKPKKDSSAGYDSEDLIDYHALLIIVLSLILCTTSYFYLNDSYYFIYSNPIHAWCLLIVGIILVSKLSSLFETSMLKLLSLTSGTRVWKVYYYAQAMQSILSSLITVAFIYYLRYFSSHFQWDYSLIAWFDPLLKFSLLLSICIFLRGLFVKHLTYIVNEQRYTKAVTDLLFKSRVLARLCDREAFQPIPNMNQPVIMVQSAADEPANIPLAELDNLETSKAKKPKKKKAPAAAEANKPHALYEMFSRLRDWNESVADQMLPGGTGRGFFSSEKLAIAKSKLLFENVDRDHKNFLTISDFRAFFPHETALRAFKLFFPPKTFQLVKTKRQEEALPSKEPPAPFNLLHDNAESQNNEGKSEEIEGKTPKKKKVSKKAKKTEDSSISRSKSMGALNKAGETGSESESRTSLSLLQDLNNPSEDDNKDIPIKKGKKPKKTIKISENKPILTEGNVLEDVITPAEQQEDEEEGSAPSNALLSSLSSATKAKKKGKTAGSVAKRAKLDFEAHIQSLKLTYEQLEARILGFHSSRQALSRQLRDLDGLADVMESLTSMIFYVIIALLCVIVFDEHIQPLMFALSTMLLSMTFIFADTLKNIFKAIILIFAVKPYQVGDRVNIGKNKFRVHSIQLLTTTFKDLQNKINIMPNSTLSNMLILNLSRSGTVVMKMKLNIAFNTPATKLAILRQHMLQHIVARPAEWKPSVSMHLASLSLNTNTVAISVLCSHLATYTQVAHWKKSKTELTHCMREKIIELGISWSNPQHSIQIINNSANLSCSLKELAEANNNGFSLDVKHINPITGQIEGKLLPASSADSPTTENTTTQLLSQ
jgi:hypothetical protein